VTTPIELLALKCTQCSTPIPAQLDEVAWVCDQCGQGLQLDEEHGLRKLDVRFAEGIQPEKKGKPFWVVEGQVDLDRKTYGVFGKKTDEAEQYWSQARRFFIPAFDISLEDLIRIGTQMLNHHPALKPGQPAAFEPVTTSPRDVQYLTEFIVLAVEAERKDKIRTIEFSLEISTPQLWILP
jgi:hypothetical protein